MSIKSTLLRFQFQMVRLKVRIGGTAIFAIGAVSIPNGSIKRDNDLTDLQHRLLFQFQMVRLKVLLPASVQVLPRSFNSKWFD